MPSNTANRFGVSEPRRQVAALAYRRHPQGGLQILLITSRDTGRWVLPKGNRMKKLTDAQAAAVEAFEEAGARGVVSKTPLGSYSYLKATKDGLLVPNMVDVYALEVAEMVDSFKEVGQRRLVWVTCEDAAAKVAEPALAYLIRTFGAPSWQT